MLRLLEYEIDDINRELRSCYRRLEHSDCREAIIAFAGRMDTILGAALARSIREGMGGATKPKIPLDTPQ